MNTIPYVIVDDATGVVVASGEVQEADFANLARPGCTVYRLAGNWQKRQRVEVVDGEPRIVEVPPPTPTLDESKADMLDRLATRRWEVETGGFTFRGRRVKSDADSQAKINGLMTGIALLGDSFHTAWKCSDGWLQLDARGARELVTAGFAHVAVCFAREGELSAAITSATEDELPELADAVEAFWPSSIPTNERHHP